ALFDGGLLVAAKVAGRDRTHIPLFLSIGQRDYRNAGVCSGDVLMCNTHEYISRTYPNHISRRRSARGLPASPRNPPRRWPQSPTPTKQMNRNFSQAPTPVASECMVSVVRPPPPTAVR